MIFQNDSVYFHFYRFLQFCTHLAFDLVECDPGSFIDLAYTRTSLCTCQGILLKMPTKRKLSDFYGFGLPSIRNEFHFSDVRGAMNHSGSRAK